MSLTISIHKTFITPLSKEDLLTFVNNKINSKSRFLFFSSNDYNGSIKENKFKFYRKFNIKLGPAYPKVIGYIKSESPTVLEIKIKPHYFRVAFFLIFPIIFISSALFSLQMTINGVLRPPVFYERLFLALFGGGLPLLWCYFDSIRPVKKTEAWLQQEWQLSEIKPLDN